MLELSKMRDKLQRVPTQVGLSSFKNQITMNTDFSALADIVQSTTFANAANGPVTVGLAMAEERGLLSDLKLRVFDPRDLINRNGPFNAFGYEYVAPVTTGTPPNAVTTPGVHNFTAILNCQKYACLLIAHRVAVDERINGTTYQKVIPLDRHKALLVAGAYVVSAYGLAGWLLGPRDLASSTLALASPPKPKTTAPTSDQLGVTKQLAAS